MEVGKPFHYQITEGLPVIRSGPQTMYLTGAGVNQYDVTGDGNRFVVVAGTTAGAPEPLHLVTNWDAELKKCDRDRF